MWCSRRPGIGRQSSPINLISILGSAHQTRLSLAHLLVQAHFLPVSLHLKDAVVCIYTRFDGSQSFSEKYQELGVLLIYYLFISIFSPGLVAILGQPGIPDTQEHLEPHPRFF